MNHTGNPVKQTRHLLRQPPRMTYQGSARPLPTPQVQPPKRPRHQPQQPADRPPTPHQELLHGELLLDTARGAFHPPTAVIRLQEPSTRPPRPPGCSAASRAARCPNTANRRPAETRPAPPPAIAPRPSPLPRRGTSAWGVGRPAPPPGPRRTTPARPPFVRSGRNLVDTPRHIGHDGTCPSFLLRLRAGPPSRPPGSDCHDPS